MPTSTRRRVLSDGDHVDTNSPPLTRARAAAAATAGTPPAPREEADDRAATLPRDADDAWAGIANVYRPHTLPNGDGIM